MSEAAPTASPSDALPAVTRPKSAPRPGPPPAPARVAAAPPPRPRSRWMDTLTALALCFAVGGVLVAAGPALLRAAGLGAPTRDDGELRNGGRLTLPQPPIGAPAHPIFSHGEEQDDDDTGRSSAAPPREGLRSTGSARDPRAPAGANKRATPGVVRRPIKLFEQPGAGGTSLGEVAAGDLVMIGKEVGDWVLIAHDGPDGVVMGWARKSEIATK